MFIGLDELEQRTLVIVTDYSDNPSFDKKNETFSKKLKAFMDLLLAGFYVKLRIAGHGFAVLGLSEDGELIEIRNRISVEDIAAGDYSAIKTTIEPTDWLSKKEFFKLINAITDESLSAMLFHSELNKKRRIN